MPSSKIHKYFFNLVDGIPPDIAISSFDIALHYIQRRSIFLWDQLLQLTPGPTGAITTIADYCNCYIVVTKTTGEI